ncbi:hypothetical protein PSHT_07552 [Puccinia striiformis]|uniref:Uncharacterized protein n=1 Tax=Puccinia striiformis TaxID=27350 RepID=A0A2S4VWK5_9BASI|nr:hypothetical protein PSHT_07552 [Puccinia striiformis]
MLSSIEKEACIKLIELLNFHINGRLISTPLRTTRRISHCLLRKSGTAKEPGLRSGECFYFVMVPYDSPS